MEALIAFDPNNYPFIFDYNHRFLDVITKITFKSEVIPADSKESCKKILQTNQNDAMTNVLVLIFAPYVASLRVLREKCNSSNLLYETVKSTKINFKDYLDHIVLHITDSNAGKSPQSKQYLSNLKVSNARKLDYFIEILKFTFGSNPSSSKSDENQNKLALSLYRHWVSLSSSSPIYLFEATDRLLVSASLKATLTLVLQTVLNKSREFLKFFGEVPSQALLYVNGKLTSEFATQSSARMSKRDVMLMQIFVESQFFRKIETRSITRSSSYQGNSGSSPMEDDMEYFGDTESDYESEATSTKSRRKSDSENIPPDVFFDDNSSSSVDTPPSGFLLFLEGSKNNAICRSPVCVRVVKVTESIIVFIISELSTRFLSRSIHCILTTLTRVLFSRQDLNGFSELHDFEKACHQLKTLFERSPTKFSRQSLQRLNDLIKCDVRKYCTGFSRTELPTRIDALCSSVCSSLRSFYHEEIYAFESNRLKKVQMLEQFKCNILSLQTFSLREASLYTEYLEVKSKINMTIDPYLQIVPGLKAFIFVDRKLNILIYADSDLKSREALPSAVDTALSGLVSGRLTSRFTQHDLTVHYFMWFEDLRGNTMKPTTTNFSLQSFPSLMGCDHVAELIDKCFPCKRRDSFCWGRETVSCYELLVLAKTSSYSPYSTSCSSPSSSSSTSTSYAVNDIDIRCKRLAGKLGEFIVPEHFMNRF